MESLSRINHFIAQRPWVIAVGISLGLVGWMASGSNAAEEPAAVNEDANAETLTSVRTLHVEPQTVHKTLNLYGKSEPNRRAMVGAETPGQIVEVVVDKGQWVKKGDLIARIGLDDRPEQLERAQKLLAQRAIEYDGARRLQERGLQGKANLAAAAADLADAQALVRSLQLSIDKTRVLAPFDGVVSQRMVEVGSYIGVGDPVFELADNQPLVVRVDVTERDIRALRVGLSADIRLVNHEVIQGKVSYISPIANDNTNTFRVEIQVDNPDGAVPAGMSAEVRLPLQEESAIKITQAALALDDAGNLGVKSVLDGHVVFTPINIVKAEDDGVWLSGFDKGTDIIVVGQGFVKAGDAVDAQPVAIKGLQ